MLDLFAQSPIIGTGAFVALAVLNQVMTTRAVRAAVAQERIVVRQREKSAEQLEDHARSWLQPKFVLWLIAASAFVYFMCWLLPDHQLFGRYEATLFRTASDPLADFAGFALGALFIGVALLLAGYLTTAFRDRRLIDPELASGQIVYAERFMLDLAGFARLTSAIPLVIAAVMTRSWFLWGGVFFCVVEYVTRRAQRRRMGGG